MFVSTLLVGAVFSSVFSVVVPVMQEGRNASTQQVELPVRFDVGFVSSIELVKEREDWTDGKLVEAAKSTTPIEVEILSKDETGFVCRWTFGKTELPPGADPLRAQLASLNAGYALDMRMDPHGSVTGFVDDAAARRKFDELMAIARKAAIAGAGEGTQGAERLGAAFDAVTATMKGPAFAAIMLKEPMTLYAWSGGTYELGVPKPYDDQLPNPFGGSPLPAKARVELREVRADAEEAVLVWDQRLDGEKTKAALFEFFRTIAEKNGEAAPRAEELPQLEIADEAEYVIDLRTGMPKAAHWSRTTSMGNRKRVDSFRVATKPRGR